MYERDFNMSREHVGNLNRCFARTFQDYQYFSKRIVPGPS